MRLLSALNGLFGMPSLRPSRAHPPQPPNHGAAHLPCLPSSLALSLSRVFLCMAQRDKSLLFHSLPTNSTTAHQLDDIPFPTGRLIPPSLQSAAASLFPIWHGMRRCVRLLCCENF